jgi:hypothetical protein
MRYGLTAHKMRIAKCRRILVICLHPNLVLHQRDYLRTRKPPRGNTVNRAPMDPGITTEPEILFTHLMEGIGLALDLKGCRMFITDLAGSIYSANLDGSNRKTLTVVGGNFSGIAYVELPA